MKPNSEKAGDMFVTPMMLEQLRYSGLLEVCTIRKMGFPIRRVFDEFMQRYGCISPSALNIDSLLSDLVQKVRVVSCGSFVPFHYVTTCSSTVYWYGVRCHTSSPLLGNVFFF